MATPQDNMRLAPVARWMRAVTLLVLPGLAVAALPAGSTPARGASPVLASALGATHSGVVAHGERGNLLTQYTLVSPSPDQNILQNGNFADGLAYWQTLAPEYTMNMAVYSDSGLPAESGFPANGPYLETNTSLEGNSFYQDISGYTFARNDTYSAGVWVRSPSGAALKLAFYLWELGGAESNASSRLDYVTSGTDWHFIAVQHTMVAGDRSSLRFQVYLYDTTATNYDFTDAFVMQGMLPATATPTSSPVPSATASPTMPASPTNTVEPTATNTSVPPTPTSSPTGTATATATPTATSTVVNNPTNTATGTPIPPTATSTPPASSTATVPTDTPVPATATSPSKGVGSTALLTPAATARTSAPSTHTAKVRAGRVEPHVAVSGHTLTVRLPAAPHTHVTLKLRVVTTKVTFVGRGKHRKRLSRTIVLYQTTRKGTADNRGQFAGSLQLAYEPSRPVTAFLTVSTRVGRGTVTLTITLMIQPAHAQGKPPHRTGRH